MNRNSNFSCSGKAAKQDHSVTEGIYDVLPYSGNFSLVQIFAYLAKKPTDDADLPPARMIHGNEKCHL